MKKNQRSYRVILLMICLGALISILPLTLPAQAQSNESTWQTPVDLSSVTGIHGWYPVITADITGNVHVFWIGWSRPKLTQTNSGDTIFYRVLKGDHWTDPIDILVVNDSLQLGNALTTRDGRLFLLWESTTRLNLSWAFIPVASDPHAWKTITIETRNGLNYQSLAYDDKRGNWYIAYSDLNGLYLMASSDEQFKRDAQLIQSADDGITYNKIGGLCVSPEDGSVQIVWTKHYAAEHFAGKEIWYARYDTNNKRVEIRDVSNTIDKNNVNFDDSTILCQSNGRVMIFWNNSVSSRTGRFYQISDNNGITWQEVGNIFINQLSGLTRHAGLASDSRNDIHLITAAMDDNYTGLRYATWDPELSWSHYQSLWPSVHGEFPDMTITHGNQLHLVWNNYVNNDERESRVLYSTLNVNSPYLTGENFDLPLNSSKSTPTLALISDQNEVNKYPISTIIIDKNPGELPNSNSGFPIMIGLLAVLILLICVLLFRFNSKR